MDSIIPLGQKNTLAEYMILSGADNHPHMFDKDLYDSWKSRMELYMKNREHGRMILELVENGPLSWPTIEENGVIRTKKYAELSAAKEIQANCDMKATNIILQGLPADIYSLVKHPVVVLTEFYGRCIANNHHKFNNNLITEGHALVVLGSLNPIINLDSFKSQEPGHYSRWQGHSEARSRETSAKAVLMANISNYGSDIISEGSHSETILNDMDKSRFDNVVKIRTTPDARTKDVLLSVMNSMYLIDKYVNVERKQNESCDKCFNLEAELLKSQNAYNNLLKRIFEKNDLKAQLQEKDSTICKLKDIIKLLREKSKEENVNYDYGEIETKNVELENIVAKLSSKNERLYKVFVITSLKNDLQKLKGKEIVDIAAQTPSTHTIVPGMFKLELEPLAPRSYLYMFKILALMRLNKNEKKVAVTPKKKVKKVEFVEPLTSSSNIKQVDVKHSLSNANSEPICANCKKSMFDGVHDKCLLDFVENMNSHAKSAKKHKKQNIWKPTGHVFTEIGFKWKPIGRTFTIVGTSCPLTRITLANVVPPKKTTSHSVETHKPELKVYSRKPKNVKNAGSSKKVKIVESKNANHLEPNHNWGSNATNIPFSSSLVMTAPLFLWVEAINTACYTQNRSIIRRRYNKTPYELMQDKKPNLSFFHVFGTLCYPTNDNDDLGKLDAKANIDIFIGYAPVKKAFRIYNKRTQKIIETIHVTFDELTAMASEQFNLGPGLHSMTPATSSSGLVPNPVSQQPCIPPPRDDWDRLFQPMFDEYFTPSSVVVSPIQEAAAPRAVVLADSPVSTSIDQDAPSTSIPSTQEQEHSSNISQGFEESPKTPIFHDDPLHESLHDASTSQGSSSNVRQIHTPFKH
ncbi:retrovirus-related pol polyprotein from transposon TNT 1-94, partial [Tanacetum coccineum]